MDIQRIGALMLTAALASGCAYYAKMTPHELAMQPATWMCAEYDRNQSPNIRAELTRRGTITPEEWALIDQKHIGIGMSEAALLCSWGFPSGRHGTINQFADAGGITQQYVYPRSYSGDPGATYVYVRDGKIIAADRID